MCSGTSTGAPGAPRRARFGPKRPFWGPIRFSSEYGHVGCPERRNGMPWSYSTILAHMTPSRPRRSIETIASFDQWSGTIKNHWKRWQKNEKTIEKSLMAMVRLPKTFNGDGLLKNHWKFAMVSSKPLKIAMVSSKPLNLSMVLLNQYFLKRMELSCGSLDSVTTEISLFVQHQLDCSTNNKYSIKN